MIIMFGPPGSGKGSISVKLAKSLKISHISTGDILRKQIKSKTDLGKEIESLISQGKLISDSVIDEIVKSELANTKKYILDGYPRTKSQATFFASYAQPKYLVHLHADDELITKRMVNRGRSDDKIDVISNRIKQYKEDTLPALETLRNLPKIKAIDIDGSRELQETVDLLLGFFK